MDIRIIGVRENKEYLDRAVKYFSDTWKIDKNIYDDCIRHSITTNNPLPRWFLSVDDDNIIGSYGLITNDFISRQDLWPWLCALYVDKKYRGKGLGAKMLSHGAAMALKAGFEKMYLCTDIGSYYEKLGWEHIGDGFHPWGEKSAIYRYDILHNIKGEINGK